MVWFSFMAFVNGKILWDGLSADVVIVDFVEERRRGGGER